LPRSSCAPGLVRSDAAEAAEGDPLVGSGATAGPRAVVDDEGLGAGGLDPDAEAREAVVPCDPWPEVGPEGLDGALGQDVEGQAHLTGWRKSSLVYNVRVAEGGFRDADGRVMGGFFGPNHEEVAGMLNDGLEKILGAFGATRSENQGSI